MPCAATATWATRASIPTTERNATLRTSISSAAGASDPEEIVGERAVDRSQMHTRAHAMHGVAAQDEHHQDDGNSLGDYCPPGGSTHAHFREAEAPQNEPVVQDDVQEVAEQARS